MKLREIPKGAAKEVYIKAIMMGTALLLLLAALIFFTTAWYTKMVSSSGVNLQAAKWDYTANHTVDAVKANVYEYASLSKDGFAAPGTGGWIPVKLGAQQSDTDIEYILTVDRSSMSEEFQQRIFFYYLEDVNNDPVAGLIDEPLGDDSPYTKVYFGDSPDGETSADPVNMVGTIPHKSEITVHIYWEWVYEAPEEYEDEEKLAWDIFDTKVGENPGLYVEDMNATVKVVGVEVNPKDQVVTSTTEDNKTE